MIYFKLVNNYENGKLIMKSVNMVLLTGRKDLTMVLRVVKKKNGLFYLYWSNLNKTLLFLNLLRDWHAKANPLAVTLQAFYFKCHRCLIILVTLPMV